MLPIARASFALPVKMRSFSFSWFWAYINRATMPSWRTRRSLYKCLKTSLVSLSASMS